MNTVVLGLVSTVCVWVFHIDHIINATVMNVSATPYTEFHAELWMVVCTEATHVVFYYQ